ncbi:hypothetical protein [Psychrobacter piscatorii]|uniref:hypothetical protein n=1 Tax=Psychrobacter piscatorii TaxID=554343 RepID=UPI0037351893
MRLEAKTITINDSTNIRLHPLAGKLYKLMMSAYIVGGQETYIKCITDKFNCYQSLPIHNVSLISEDTNKYLLIGGCFSPVFNRKDLNNRNTIFLSYRTSKHNFKPEHKSEIDKEFDQDVIDFIFMDFIRAISMLSLSKPGILYKSLKEITQKHKSPIWSEIFNREAKNPKDYVLLNNVADLLDTTRGALNNQAKLEK